jgi:hypothetical protein
MKYTNIFHCKTIRYLPWTLARGRIKKITFYAIPAKLRQLYYMVPRLEFDNYTTFYIRINSLQLRTDGQGPILKA